MELLSSNYQPLKTDNKSFNTKFNDLLGESAQLDMAVGYISEKSLDYLGETIHKNGGPICNLTIGMHYFDKFTHSQFASALEIEKYLVSNNLGTVKLVTSFPFHGKLYSFSDEIGNLSSIVGSSNLSNILLHNASRQYEFDMFIDDSSTNKDISNFIKSLMNVSLDLSNPDLQINDFKKVNNLLEGLPGVRKLIYDEELSLIKSKIIETNTANIPLKADDVAPLSNINACFGKGRENKDTQIIRNRPWYEVELIVPKEITDLNWYPKAGYPDTVSIIKVITDDGYEFECKISGTNSKNFRSVGDLRILGKWLKGRLENVGALKVGQSVSEKVLENYGRNTIKMSKTEIDNTYFLDFGVNK